jgi:endonuclease/exonuclease/phosphatase family metal-dependent hydrolase
VCSAEAQSGDAPMIRIGTWNLWWRFGSWQARYSAILAVLRAAKLDVCGLQEVWTDGPDNLARLLADALGMHWSFSPSPEPERWRARLPESSAGVGNAILARWPIQDVADLALPPGGSGDRSRTALAGVVDSPYGRVPLATTQLTAAPWDSVARCRQVRALVKFLGRRQREDYPTILVGDLNAEPDSDEVRLLCGHKTAPAASRFVLVDAWRYATDAVPWTWDRANPHVLATGEPSSRIDYVLIGPPHASHRGHVRSARRIGEKPVAGVWPSDHAGVIAELDGRVSQSDAVGSDLEY